MLSQKLPDGGMREDEALISSPGTGSKLYIAESKGKGRGLFAACFIPAGAVVEVAPVIVLSKRESDLVMQTCLKHYIFEWIESDTPDNLGPDDPADAVALGKGSLFNHSADPNAAMTLNYADKTITFTARKDIGKDEEVLIDYDMPLWF